MSENPPPNASATGANPPEGKLNGLLNVMVNPTPGGAAVGPLAVAIAVLFLVVLTGSLLYGITKQWPVCDLPEENRPASENTNSNNGTATPAKDRSPATPAENANVAANANVATNSNANTPANRNAAVAQTNTNTNANASSSATKPSSTEDDTTKLDADTIEPTSGPIMGKTLVTIKGKNFGSTREDLVVKFGETEAKVNQVTDKTISVSTGRHSEGLVDVTVTKGLKSDVLPSAYTYTCPPPSGSGLFLMLIMAGGLGGCIHALRSLYWYSGQGELKWRWMPMYFVLPFMGAAMAMIFSLLIFAGFVDQTAGKSQALFIIAVAGLVGMFSQQAALKLTDIANAFFTKPGKGENSKPQESLSVGQEQKPLPLTVTAVSPSEGTGDGKQKVMLTGSGFNKSTTISFGGESAKIEGPIDANSITVLAPQHAPGEVDVVVTSGDQSVTFPTKFKYN
jgi:hypothetical protein